MKILVQVCIIIPLFIALFTCRSSDDFRYAESEDQDSDPSLYFTRNAGVPYRAAVLSFTSDEGIAFFDAFVTDEVIRRLSAAGNLKLVERSRIDLVIQEHELAQAGLVSGKNALRLGTLLAVDHLVIGTYLYKNETIHVRGRTIEVKSGKVGSAFAFRIPYRGTKTAAPAEDALKTDEGCEAVQRPVYLALHDLSTPAAVERAVDRAIAVPWKKPCGRVHMKVNTEFARTNLFPRRYHEFLVKTLESMETPHDEYYTVREIFSYFARDGNISEFEWAAARETMKRGWHPFYLKYFFKPERYSDVVMKRRALELIELARRGEIGRPYALSEYRVGDDLLTNPFTRSTEKGIAFSLFILRSLTDPGRAAPKEAALFFRILAACYEDTLTPEYRRESMDMLIGFLKSRPPDSEFADMLWQFLHEMEEKAGQKPARHIPRLAYDPADLKKFNSELREYLCLRLSDGTGRYSDDELKDYLRRHGVRCAGGP